MSRPTTKPTPDLTKPQEALLRQMVKSNGGGASLGPSWQRTSAMRVAERLEALGLSQRKSGNDGRGVHTRAGLEWVRMADRYACCGMAACFNEDSGVSCDALPNGRGRRPEPMRTTTPEAPDAE